MNIKYLIVGLALLSGFGLQAKSTEQRIANLEHQLNEILKSEKERIEAINKLADLIRELEEKVEAEEGAGSGVQMPRLQLLKQSNYSR